MTERRIDARNHRDLADGREDVAAMIVQEDVRWALRLKLSRALTAATLPELEAMEAVLTVAEPLPIEDDEVEPGVHFEGGFYA